MSRFGKALDHRIHPGMSHPIFLSSRFAHKLRWLLLALSLLVVPRAITGAETGAEVISVLRATTGLADGREYGSLPNPR